LADREAAARPRVAAFLSSANRRSRSSDSSRNYTVIIQGFGNVGSNAARLMAEAGYQVIGIVEVGGGLYNKNGINVEALWDFRQGTVPGPGVRTVHS